MSWGQTQLGNLISISKGKKHTPIINGTHRYINIEDLHRNTNPQFTNDQGVWCNQNDLIIAWDGANAGKVGVGYEGVIGSTLARLSIKNQDVDARFLFWFLDAKNETIKSQRTGATIPHINGSSLKDILIPLPPLPIQKRIAEILDAADALKRKDQELLKKYDELAQSIFIDMFGDPVKNEKGWEIVKLGDSLEFMTSGSRGWARYYSNSGDLFLRINNVCRNSLVMNDVVYVKAPANAESNRTRVKAGDILFSITADLGRTAVIPKNFPTAFINQHLAILRFKENFNPFFVAEVLSSDLGVNQVKKLNKGGVKAGLNFDDIKSLHFINPPLDTQELYNEIISFLQKVKGKALVASIDSQRLFYSLIEKAFTGELVS